MKAFPSFHSVKNETKPVKNETKSSISLPNYGKIDLNEDREDRRDARKLSARRSTNHSDEVRFVDLPFTSNYAAHLHDCITPGLTLNIKGILANLHFKFQAIARNPADSVTVSEDIMQFLNVP